MAIGPLRSAVFDSRRDSAPAERDWELAASFIPAGAHVLDLGPPGLQPHLSNGCVYRSSNLCDRGDDGFGTAEFPAEAAAQSDLIVLLGVLERVRDVEALLSHLGRSRRDVVLSYCPTDLVGAEDRQACGFANHFSLENLAVLFDRFGLRIACADNIDGQQLLMKLAPVDRAAALPSCSVAVVSYNDVGNFGDRLGYHIVNGLMPASAEVHHLTFRTLHKARASYDLVVLGIGNSVFDPLLGDDVLDVVSRGKAAIGIFGTQYRELIPRPALDRLLDRLDTWYARYEDDVLMFGRGRSNVRHLGDWLIDQFPMTTPTEDALLEIGDDILADLPLDRSIQSIQRYKNVFSKRLHPFLCALTSAELVAYAKQYDPNVPGIASGKFRSMLIDIFGRSFPEKKFFIVDRAAVAQYKARVHRNVAEVGQRIEAILRNVAVAAA